MSGVVEDIFDTFVMFILKEFPEEISEALDYFDIHRRPINQARRLFMSFFHGRGKTNFPRDYSKIILI